MRFGEQYNTANHFRKSFALLKENLKLFPEFEYNNTFFGLEEAVVGSLPGNYKWLASIFGMKGSVKNGTSKLNAFIGAHNSNDPFYAETVLYAIYTRFYLLPEQKEVWDLLNSKSFSMYNNLLNTYVKANLALDLRRSDEAVQTLKAASGDASFGLYPVFDYQMGCAIYNPCDTSADAYFNRYLKKNRSDLYIKDCWQRMALIWYLSGDINKATYCRSQISKNGTARIDADKQAQKFAEAGIWPNKILLRSRLLIEAGYYNKALTTLATIDNAALSNPTDKAEYYFRMARIYEETDNLSKAIEYYQYTINTGKDRHEQFAARAALQMGKMYERSNKPLLAMQRYKECLQLPSHDFQNSIDQQAKAGINRLEGK
jgi:tetratricopeptide (TPR) repeat protein